MKSLFGIWSKPRLLVLASYTAALYAAVVIPFKYGMPIIPGATEVRPGIAVLLMCSFLFGPAAAWGGAFGNLIGDFFGGTLGPGSFFGFLGNFLYGYLPYKMWEVTGGGSLERPSGIGWWLRFILICWVSSAVCASVIAWGIELVFHVPLMFLGGIIFSNNLLLPLALTPILIRLISPRLHAWGLTYEQIESSRSRPGSLAPVGAFLAILSGISAGLIMLVGFVAMFLPDLGLLSLENYPLLGKILGQFNQPVSIRAGGYTRAWAIMSVPIAGFFLAAVLIGHERRADETEDAIDVDHTEPGIGPEPDGNETALKNVTFTYQGETEPALNNISFGVKPGEYVVIMGRTGAGKTSLVRCLTGAIPYFYSGSFGGKAFIRGREINTGPAENAGRVGMVFQDFESQLFSTNAELEVAFGAENLGVPRDELRVLVKESLSRVGLEGFEGRDPAELSGGEKQRLAIASILAMKPPLLILDEPSTDLDPVGKGEIFDILADLKGDEGSVVLVEHEIEAARNADRVLLMREGEIIREGLPDEIFGDVDLLLEHGIRPLDSIKLLRALGEKSPVKSLDETIDTLKSTGKIPSDDKYAQLKKEEGKRKEDYGETLFELKGLKHSYNESTEALRGVDLKIHKGEFLAILGRNGSGKTTLAKHLNGLLKPTVGEANFNGEAVTSRPLSEVAKQVGFVFQDPDHQIFSSTVADELAFAPRNFGLSEVEIAARVKKALEITNLDGYENRDPFHLTKGERQRVAVASALAGEPDVIILDEPTTGLDLDEQAGIMELLKKLNEQGHTVIIITHTVWVAVEYAHRTILMSGGKIIADGSTRDVFAMKMKGELAEARVRPPQITEIGWAFDKVFLSVEEYLECL